MAMRSVCSGFNPGSVCDELVVDSDRMKRSGGRSTVVTDRAERRGEGVGVLVEDVNLLN